MLHCNSTLTRKLAYASWDLTGDLLSLAHVQIDKCWTLYGNERTPSFLSYVRLVNEGHRVERLHILYLLYFSLQVQNVTMGWRLFRIQSYSREGGNSLCNLISQEIMLVMYMVFLHPSNIHLPLHSQISNLTKILSSLAINSYVILELVTCRPVSQTYAYCMDFEHGSLSHYIIF